MKSVKSNSDFYLNSLTEQIKQLSSEITTEYQSKLFAISESDVSLESQRSREKHFLEIVRTGNVAEANKLIQNLATEGFPPSIQKMIDENDLSGLHIAATTCINLCCREAIDAGTPEIIALRISNTFFELGRRNAYNPVIQGLLCILPGKDFANAVSKWVIADSHPAIKECYTYILNHLHDQITLDNLSQACNLSPNYISDLFKKELGVRPITFIRNIKLMCSKYLLLNTKHSVSEIASLLSFPSASAYTSQFKEEYNITPLQFRKHPN